MKTYILPDGREIVIHDETLHRWRKTIEFTLADGAIVVAVEAQAFEKTPRAAASLFARQLMNDRGEYETVAEIVSRMQDAGTDQRLIDRWLQGLERGAR